MRDRRRQRVLVKRNGHVRTQMADREFGLVVMPEQFDIGELRGAVGYREFRQPGLDIRERHGQRRADMLGAIDLEPLHRALERGVAGGCEADASEEVHPRVGGKSRIGLMTTRPNSSVPASIVIVPPSPKELPSFAGHARTQPQGCVQTVDLDVNPNSPYNPASRP
jgi:hypothetical protein